MKISILLFTAFVGLALAKDEKHCDECEKRYNNCMKVRLPLELDQTNIHVLFKAYHRKPWDRSPWDTHCQDNVCTIDQFCKERCVFPKCQGH
jgi:hypothetical protein